MKLSIDRISFLSNFLVLPEQFAEITPIAMTLQGELMQRGYMMSNDALSRLSALSEERIIEMYSDLLEFIDEMMGNGDYTAIYSDFPQRVMEMSEFELWIDQITHYFSFGTFIPEVKFQKGVAFEHVKYKTITAGTQSDFMEVFTKLTTTPVALSGQDKEIYDWFIQTYDKELSKWVSPNISFKELMCELIVLGLYRPKTVTDVLRYAVSISGGDIELPPLPPKQIRVSRWFNVMERNKARDAFRFKKMTRAERKEILSYFETSNLDVHEMKPRADRFIKLAEILHPGEYAKRFPKTAAAFNTLRNDKVSSWYGELNKTANLTAYCDKLCERPGEFARRLDATLRLCTTIDETSMVLDKFKSVAAKVSTKVLFEMYKHFNKRDKEYTRQIFVKGSSKPSKLPVLTPMSSITLEATKGAIVHALKEHYAMKPSLSGKVCIIDESLRKLPVPLDMRNVSDSLTQTIRGKRIPINLDKKTLRFYTHWIDKTGHEDLDLSAVFYADGKFVEALSFSTHLKLNIGCHSGDVRQRKGNCAEYIDINVDNAIKEGIDLCVVTVTNFRGKPLNTVSATAGWMSREKPERNDTWLPSTVEHSFKLENECATNVVAVIDLKNMDIIVLDMGYDELPVASLNVDKYLSLIQQYTLNGISMYDILEWNITARGGIILKEDSLNVLKINDENIMYFSDEHFANYKDMLEYMI